MTGIDRAGISHVRAAGLGSSSLEPGISLRTANRRSRTDTRGNARQIRSEIHRTAIDTRPLPSATDGFGAVITRRPRGPFTFIAAL